MVSTIENHTTLLLYELLRHRKPLSLEETQQYERLRQGYLGEKLLEEFVLATNNANLISLFDCLFDVNETEFQIDCILLTTDTIFLLEVKHYTGDYYLVNKKVHYLPTQKEIRDPLLQIERTAFLFKQLLAQLNFNFDVRSYVVFTNKEFWLYGSSPHLPMIFLPQIPKFLQKVGANASVITEQVRRLANLLSTRRKEKSRYERLPEYQLEEMRRGVFCKRCNVELNRKNRSKFICPACSIEYKADGVILNATASFQLLFPDKKVTTSTITEWCGGEMTRKGIGTILQKHLAYHANGKFSYYTFKHYNDIYEIITNWKIQTK